MLRPEDRVGSTIEIDGVSYRTGPIIGTGQVGIVYLLTNLATGLSDQVLKISRLHDSELVPQLHHGLRHALEHIIEDPDRVIRICERLMTLDPYSDVAPFNKAVALMVKGDFTSALKQ
jgi:hypothetical protein